MAPSGADKENKYRNWSLAELITECEKRKIKTQETDTKDHLIELLIKADNKPPDWGKIYARVLYHTGMGYEEIARRTIPQLMAILDGAEENIRIKVGMPNILGLPSSGQGQSENEVQKPDKPPTLSQFANFAGLFNT